MREQNLYCDHCGMNSRESADYDKRWPTLVPKSWLKVKIERDYKDSEETHLCEECSASFEMLLKENMRRMKDKVLPEKEKSKSIFQWVFWFFN